MLRLGLTTTFHDESSGELHIRKRQEITQSEGSQSTNTDMVTQTFRKDVRENVRSDNRGITNAVNFETPIPNPAKPANSTLVAHRVMFGESQLWCLCVRLIAKRFQCVFPDFANSSLRGPRGHWRRCMGRTRRLEQKNSRPPSHIHQEESRHKQRRFSQMRHLRDTLVSASTATNWLSAGPKEGHFERRRQLQSVYRLDNSWSTVLGGHGLAWAGGERKGETGKSANCEYKILLTTTVS